MRTICFISDGRTSHGIYKPVLDKIKLNKDLNYKYILSGFHYGKKHGDTYKFVMEEGYKISHKIHLKINSNIESKQLLIIEYYISEIRKFLETNHVDIFLGQGDRIITLGIFYFRFDNIIRKLIFCHNKYFVIFFKMIYKSNPT